MKRLIIYFDKTPWVLGNAKCNHLEEFIWSVSPLFLDTSAALTDPVQPPSPEGRTKCKLPLFAQERGLNIQSGRNDKQINCSSVSLHQGLCLCDCAWHDFEMWMRESKFQGGYFVIKRFNEEVW